VKEAAAVPKATPRNSRRVAGGGGDQRARKAESWHQEKARDQYARRASQRVQEVGHGHAESRVVTVTADQTGRHEREGRT
jgi:hypothetical protein